MATVILSAARTPFGKVGGALAPVTSVELGKTAAKAAIERAGVAPEDFDYTIFGQVIQAGVGHIPSRQVSRGVGIPDDIGSDTVNKVCASGLRAATLGDQFIRAGDHQLLLVGGMESMSNAPYLLTKGRYGYRFGDAEIEDAMLQDALRDPWSGLLMYEQAGQVATELGIDRADLDQWAARSHARAVAAIDGGQMAEEIAAVTIAGRKGDTVVETDEGPRRDTSFEKLQALRPLVKDHPTHTAGNSPGVNDGAAALVIASEDYAEKHDLKPIARIRSIGYTANRHDSLAKVPAAAAKIALDRAGVSVDDVDRFEINEAFASVALQSTRDLGADPEKVNLQGGAIALGHPVGASGARLLTTLIYQLRREGGGIAQVAAQAGAQVTLVDVSDEVLQRGLGTIRKSLARLQEKGQVDDAEAVVARIAPSTELDAGSDAGLLIEAVSERFELKADVFRRADALLGPDAILATNTSSIPIGRLAAVTGRPAQVCGMHFMNPVPVLKLVELIRGLQTSDETAAKVRDTAEAMGKTVAESRDVPGFIANRILMPMLNEAVYCLYEGVGDAEAIDTVMKLGMAHPMGPLALADLIGLDTCLAILEVLHDGLGDPKYRPCPLFRQYVDAGWLGRKTGRGFYAY